MAEEKMIGLPDDCSLTADERLRIRREAERALREAGALGVFPTPVRQIMEVAKVTEVDEDVLNPGFIARLRGSVSGALKMAVGKIQGVFHAVAGLVYLDQSLYELRKKFVRLHEAAHGFLPWQRPMYALVEDCEQALEPDTAELFDREANTFASEVLFQLDTFRDLAEQKPFEIWTPIKLARKFDASLYASIRQYVSKNWRCCAVLVLNMPKPAEGAGFRAPVRRFIQSDSFTEKFGKAHWKTVYTPDDPIGALVPVAQQKSSGKRLLVLTDSNGDRHECIAESFTQTHQVFVLIHAKEILTTSMVLLPAA
jgi:hypothetical protein